MTIVQRILRYNRGRDPELLARKYAHLAQSPFVFLRGSCHLFFEDWHGGRELDAAPRAWICGDLHLENFGSYKGDNRLAYFDLNDFDEAALAPCTWEIARFLVSLGVAARGLGLRLSLARKLGRTFLSAYVQALADGKPRWIERTLAIGMIGELLGQVRRRKRRAFLDRHTQLAGKRRHFVIDGEHLVATDAQQRHQLESWFERFAVRQSDPKFYRVLDLARRVAGTGSLGLPRYVALVRGKGSPHGNYLLDLKAAGDSAAGARLPAQQPRWRSGGERIVTVQKRGQAIAPAFLMPVRYAGRSFVLKELQPLQDRLSLEQACGEPARFFEIMTAMGHLVAWSALRSSGRQGAANADALIAFAHERAGVASYVTM